MSPGNESAKLNLDQVQKLHRQLQRGMTELIERKDYVEAERIFRLVDTQMLQLIQHLGGYTTLDL